jgi:hypothetical protein
MDDNVLILLLFFSICEPSFFLIPLLLCLYIIRVQTLASVSPGSEYTLKEGAAEPISWGPYFWGTTLFAGAAAGVAYILHKNKYF